jgi:hypothetical protein
MQLNHERRHNAMRHQFGLVLIQFLFENRLTLVNLLNRRMITRRLGQQSLNNLILKDEVLDLSDIKNTFERPSFSQANNSAEVVITKHE